MKSVACETKAEMICGHVDRKINYSIIESVDSISRDSPDCPYTLRSLLFAGTNFSEFHDSLI